ncbi:MAG: ATP-binding protein [Kiritimatiellae bacterium]|nr:ATP-binding protein [Kiritimatiellia bacterium]
MGNYRKRVADALLASKLAGKGAVLIEGPKWCGKTTTAEQIAKSVLYMADQDSLARNLQIADFKPSRLLEGAKPRLLDEWQIAPKLWDAVRFAVDHTSGFGHFILTGSTVPDERRDEIQHSGTGRISRMKMRPMSLWESGESSGTVSLGNLFGQGDFDGGESALTLEELAFMTCRGGWPSVVGMKGKTALDQSFDYVESVTESDISKPDGVSRDPDTARRIMHSYARLQGTQAAYTVIRNDIANHEIDSFNEDTIASYVGALKKIFVVEDMKAWCPNLRCKTPVRTGDTRYFADPSIATAAMGVSPADLMDDLPTFGLMFEALAVRDLRTYAELIDGKLYHYLDKSGLECDIVIHLRNGCYGLVEVKLGGDRLIEKGASSLLSVAGKIDLTRMKKPSFLMVLVADGDFAYRRKDDGVVVCPIGCLKP